MTRRKRICSFDNRGLNISTNNKTSEKFLGGQGENGQGVVRCRFTII